MKRLPLILCLAALLAAPAAAREPATQLERLVARELPSLGFDVDVTTLSPHQVAAIYGALHRKDSTSEKRAKIRSILGGRYSLRGLLFD